MDGTREERLCNDEADHRSPVTGEAACTKNFRKES
jgi:hypothetical protein